jgi:hypothetical protein
MKILVNNDKEKELVKRFLIAMRELDGIDGIVELDEKTADGDDLYFQADDRLFLEDAINNAKVEVNEKVYPLCVEHYHVTGTCVDCGTQTEGTVDGEDISYEDYLEMTSPERLKEWKCESCQNKGAAE